MPRSSYIYTVFCPVRALILSAFTVKHELVDWMHQRPGLRGEVIIHRHRDGDMEQQNGGVVITPDIEKEAYDEDQA